MKLIFCSEINWGWRVGCECVGGPPWIKNTFRCGKKKSVFNKPFNPAKWLEERGEKKKDDNSYEELKI